MGSFAIEEAPSLVPALYATLIIRIAKGFLDKKSVASLLRLPDLYYGQTTLYAVKAAKTLDRFPASLAFRSK